jgi:hypothetical protein
VEPENFKADDLRSAVERIESCIVRRLYYHTPALRRVVSFSIVFSLDFLREKTGVTVEDLKGLEQQFGTRDSAPTDFCPAMPTLMEEWATHTVVTDFSGRRRVIYPNSNLGHYSNYPEVIWSHSLPGTTAFGQMGGNLEVVRFCDSIHFWARGGRFGPQSGQAKPEYCLVHPR